MRTLIDDISELEQDNRSGSRLITQRALEAMIEFFARTDHLLTDTQVSQFLASIDRLVAVHNQFASLSKLADDLKEHLRKNRGDIAEYLRSLRQDIEGMDQRLSAMTFRQLWPGNKSYLLHSQSTSVLGYFQYLADRGRRAKLFQTESRPCLEGRDQARALQSMGFEVELVVDSAVGLVINEVDSILLGADSVAPDFFVNKIGSYAIALLGQHFEVPVYVIADTYKFKGTDSVPIEKPKDPSEIWSSAPEKLKVRNQYFERIPNRLATGFICEHGLETHSTISKLFSRG